ncbi:MAG: hypothetical protein ACOYIG_06330 [Acetivibrionales bacterium]
MESPIKTVSHRIAIEPFADIMRAAQEFHPEIICGRYAIMLRFTHDIDRLCENCFNIQVIILYYAIVNKRRGCCDLKRSKDCVASATGN